MGEIRDRIYKILRESKISFMEGTSNFMLFDSPNLAFTDEDLEINNLTYLFSKYNLPSWFENTRNFETHLIDSDLDEDFAFVGARYGYYEGINIGIVKNDEFEEWAYNNYEEIDGTYYEYNSDKPISKEELRKEFDDRVEEQYQKGIEKLKELKRDYGGKFINVASRASNGETFYNEFDDVEESAELEEGWKDNLKKGVATLGVAGALAGNAMAHDPMYDGARRPFDDTDMTVQQLSNEDEKATVLPNGMIKDQYGNEWTKEDWERLMRGEDPFADNDDIHEEVNEAVENPAVDEVKKRLSKEFVDLEVTGPTYDKYDPDEPREGKIQYYIKVPEDFYEGRYLERMLREVQNKYPDFEYEGRDFSDRYWFVINK